MRQPLVGGQSLTATLPYAVRTFLQCLVSQIAPAVVWQASHPDYRAWAQAARAARYGYAQKLPDIPAGSTVLGLNYDTGERYLSVDGYLPA